MSTANWEVSRLASKEQPPPRLILSYKSLNGKNEKHSQHKAKVTDVKANRFILAGGPLLVGCHLFCCSGFWGHAVSSNRWVGRQAAGFWQPEATGCHFSPLLSWMQGRHCNQALGCQSPGLEHLSAAQLSCGGGPANPTSAAAVERGIPSSLSPPASECTTTSDCWARENIWPATGIIEKGQERQIWPAAGNNQKQVGKRWQRCCCLASSTEDTQKHQRRGRSWQC